jgi:hypothetical protein
MKEINFFKRFDRSSKVLILLSLLGIFVSLIGLRWTFFTENQEGKTGEVIASITLSRADTRVKRSGNMHWYQVAESINCYQDDMVFTGEDSTATIEFPSGDKIYLLPHSLVSVSSQLITLESGAIEVDVSGKEQFKFETLGKVVELREPTRFKVIQTEKERKVVPIKGNAPAADILGVIELKQPPKIQELFELIRPRAGEIFPSLPGTKISFEWRYTGVDQNFQVEIDGKKTAVTGNRIELNREDLAPGKISWKITNSAQESQESYFEINDQFAITLNYPEYQQEILLENTTERQVEFKWSNPLDLPQKFELARDNSFQQMILSQVTARKSVQVNLGAGEYFWRVGFPENGKVIYWSAVNSFKLSLIAAPTLALTQVPGSWDFSLNPTLNLEIDSSQDVGKLRFVLTGPMQLAGKTKKDFVILKNLKDGTYNIQLFGFFRNKEIKSEIYEFIVKNSKPLTPPKIKNSKLKLFVEVFHRIFNAIMPSAFADSGPKFPLTWEGKPASTFELEIWDEKKSKIIHKKQTAKPTYDFSIPQPGKFFWRVREGQEGDWGPFSDYAEIEAQDKVEVLEKPLMKNAYTDGKNIIFTWNEPYPDFEYYLEIYKQQSQTPVLSLKVNGGTKKFDPRLSDEKHYWRIKAVSVWGNQNPNRDKQLLNPQDESLQGNGKDKNLYIFRAAYFMTSSSYSQEPEDATLQDVNKSFSLSGSSYQLRGEVWPAKFDRKYGLHFVHRNHALSDNDNQLSESEFIGEAGYVLKRQQGRSHLIFGGFNYSTVNIDFDGTKGSYTKSYGTIRYQFNQSIHQKLSFTIDTTLLQSLQLDLSAPSIRLSPMLNWHFSPRWSVSLLAAYERNQSNPQYNEQGLEGQLEIANTISTYGLMLNWSSF